MTRETITLAVIEARRFLDAAEVVLKTGDATTYTQHLYQSKDNARVKRASMDLTRALAEMRKP